MQDKYIKKIFSCSLWVCLFNQYLYEKTLLAIFYTTDKIKSMTICGMPFILLEKNFTLWNILLCSILVPFTMCRFYRIHSLFSVSTTEDFPLVLTISKQFQSIVSKTRQSLSLVSSTF